MPHIEPQFIQALASGNYQQFKQIIDLYHRKHERCYNESLINSLNSLSGNHELYQIAIKYLLELGYEEDKLIAAFDSSGRESRTISDELYEHACNVIGFQDTGEC